MVEERGGYLRSDNGRFVMNGSGSDTRADPDLADLTNVFHMPMVRAADKIGVSKDMLRIISRRYGIQRWPYERIACLQRCMQRCLAHNARGDDVAVLASSQQRNTRLFLIASRQLEEIYTSPNIAIDPELKRARVARLKREQRFRNKEQKNRRRGHPRSPRSISRRRGRSNIVIRGGEREREGEGEGEGEGEREGDDLAMVDDSYGAAFGCMWVTNDDDDRKVFPTYFDIESVETLLETVLEAVKVTDHRDWNACGSLEMMKLLDDNDDDDDDDDGDLSLIISQNRS